VLALACAAAPGVATPTASEPGPELTLCERPARSAATLQSPELEASFRAFATTWLDRIRKGGARLGSRRILAAFETELRPTRDPSAPYVGLLRYCEHVVPCKGPAAASCAPSRRSVVTEIFRYQGGAWRP
jgi:hypothetical protein